MCPIATGKSPTCGNQAISDTPRQSPSASGAPHQQSTQGRNYQWNKLLWQNSKGKIWDLSWAVQLANKSLCNQCTEFGLQLMLHSASEQSPRTAAAVATIGGPAHVRRYWCQFKRIRGNMKERLLYRGRNGLRGQLAGTQSGTKAYDPLHLGQQLSGRIFHEVTPRLPPPLRNRAYGLCWRGYCRIYRVTKAKHGKTPLRMSHYQLNGYIQMAMSGWCGLWKLAGWLCQWQLIAQPKGKIPFSDQESLKIPGWNKDCKEWMNESWFREAGWLKC